MSTTLYEQFLKQHEIQSNFIHQEIVDDWRVAINKDDLKT